MPRPSKEYHAFTSLVDRLLKVPKSTIDQRAADHREASAQNPNKRGPKRKTV